MSMGSVEIVHGFSGNCQWVQCKLYMAMGSLETVHDYSGNSPCPWV